MARNRQRNNNRRRGKQPVVVVTRNTRRNRRPQRARQPRNQITVIGKAIRGAGALAGGMFGASRLGRSVGATISRVFGQGDYVTNNPMNNSLFAGGPPTFSPLTSGFRIRHREFIKDVNSSTGFAATSYRINPGLPDLFPWLSQVASNFEEYKIHGMCVWLNSSSATAVSSTNTALGIWGIVTQYDAAEDDFTNKQQCENYVGAQSAVPSKSILHGIECKPGSNVLDKYFVRKGELSADLDIKFYDQGKVQVFTQGSQAVSVIGELWVTYDIEFTKPRLSSSVAINPQVDAYALLGTTALNPLGTGGQTKIGSSGNCYLDPANRQIIFPVGAPNGVYTIQLEYQGTTQTATTKAPDPTYYGSVVAYGAPFPITSASIPSTTDAATRVMYRYYIAKTSTQQGSIQFAMNGNLPTGSMVAQAIIFMLPSAMAPLSMSKRMTTNELSDIRKVMQMLKGVDMSKISKFLLAESEDEHHDDDQIPIRKETASYEQV